MWKDHLWRWNEIFSIGCGQWLRGQRCLTWGCSSACSPRTRAGRCQWSPCIPDWNLQRRENVLMRTCEFFLQRNLIAQHNAPLDSILCGIFSSFSSVLALLSLSSSLAVRGDSSLSNVWESLIRSPSCGVKINTTLMEQNENDKSIFHNTTPVSFM